MFLAPFKSLSMLQLQHFRTHTGIPRYFPLPASVRIRRGNLPDVTTPHPLIAQGGCTKPVLLKKGIAYDVSWKHEADAPFFLKKHIFDTFFIVSSKVKQHLTINSIIIL